MPNKKHCSYSGLSPSAIIREMNSEIERKSAEERGVYHPSREQVTQFNQNQSTDTEGQKQTA